MKTIYYAGNFKFPDGDAGAHRVLNIGKVLSAAGHKVVFLGSEYEGRVEDFNNGKYFYSGFQYIPAVHKGGKKYEKIKRLLLHHITAFGILGRLRKISDLAPGTIIILYQPSIISFLQLKLLCRRKKILMITDVVEWYDPSHVIGGRFGFFAMDSELRMRFAYNKSDGVFGISSYLENFYVNKNVSVLRIPVLIDKEDEHWSFSKLKLKKSRFFKIAFIGNAGKKDYLTSAIRGLSLICKYEKNVKMIVVGPTLQQVRKSLGKDACLLNQLKSNIEILGPLSHKDALKKLALADFSILIRPDKRFAHAGFPTKLVESLAMGVPVICNLTSDVGMYVEDGVEAIIVDDCSPEAFASGLHRALNLSDESLSLMRNAARNRAVLSFDYRPWVATIDDFIRRELSIKLG